MTYLCFVLFSSFPTHINYQDLAIPPLGETPGPILAGDFLKTGEDLVKLGIVLCEFLLKVEL